jgi:YidC/Oxa1 family membrane protein insertase
VLGLSSRAGGGASQLRRALPTLVLTRHYSKESPAPVASEATGTTNSEAVEAASSAPVPPADVVSSATDSASSLADTTASTFDAIHTPLQYGDLSALGLASWSPAGLVQWSMEIINTTTHLPWFWTIIAGTAFWRLAVLPFSLRGLRNTSRLLPYQDQITKIQADMNKAAVGGDPLTRQKLAFKLKEIYQTAGVSVFGGLMIPAVQIPVTFGMFIGIKNMCSLPVEQMKWSGLQWLPDLTVADPTWVLPILGVALVNIQIPFGAAEMDLKTRPSLPHIMNAMRVLSVASIFVTIFLPSVSGASLIPDRWKRVY